MAGGIDGPYPPPEPFSASARKTLGTIGAVILAAGLLVGGYFAFNAIKAGRDAQSNKTIAAQDSVRIVKDTTLERQVKDLVMQSKQTLRLAATAGARLTDAQAQLKAAKDSLATLAAVPVDSSPRIVAVPTIPVEVAQEFVHRQWRADSLVIEAKDSVIVSVVAERDTAKSQVKTAQAIGDTFKKSYEAEKAKTRPKWQSVSIEIGKGLLVAALTHALFK